MKARSKGLYVGTSGWTYDDWRGPFYPKDIPKKSWLAWYAGQFAATEINGSFYSTPSIAAVEAWRESTPPQFRFAWKASQFITHWKRLRDPEGSIALLETRLEVLGSKCGPVLFQLPGRFHADRERLAAFLAKLPRAYRYVFEFRHESWYAEPVLSVLRDHDVALCFSDHHEAPAPWTVTARHVYVRGHGPTGRYKGHYPDTTLRSWAGLIRSWRKRRRPVYVFFDNDQKSAAPQDAERLLTLLGER
jgi:uncharacterized protein YecE (DUF72 family)